MKFSVITLFPELIASIAGSSILGRAVKNEYLEINPVYLRDYSGNKHGKVDDSTYGGGAGLLIRPQCVYDAITDLRGDRKVRTIYLTPQGKPFTQDMAEELSQEEELIFLCGHYEGVDERVLDKCITDRVSVGDYVLTGGELPAMIMIDAIARLLPGVLGNEASSEIESFHKDLLEYPQYTKPEVWHGKAVPEVLLTGDHEKIESWRLDRSIEITKEKRPDLYEKYLYRTGRIQKLLARKKLHAPVVNLFQTGKERVLYDDADLLLVTGKDRKEAFLTALSVNDQERASAPEDLRERLCSLAAGTVLYADADLFTLLSREMADRAEFGRFYVYTEKSPLPMPRHADPEEKKALVFKANEAFRAGEFPWVYFPEGASSDLTDSLRFYPSEAPVLRILL
ncbi:MAG: tRNA (guanosine(37)-N1)-methyltransferase TrmD [Lachnospiraceae bacterium]|nr:tRNA (guanosine(37)-N1)-methyltransferase TrmD [Lachnospiraceae bacterium]